MKLLLDTHIWVWSLGSPERLSRRVTRELENEANELWLSPISVWEALMLAEKRRIECKPSPEAWIERAWGAAAFKEAPLNRAVAIESRRLRFSQKDPADRFLAATAVVYELTLVTADVHLLGTRQFPTLANR